MTNRQLMLFKKQLLEWKNSIETNKELEIQLDHIEQNIDDADENDVIDKNNIIDFQEKRKKYQEHLLKEINHAIRKIDNNTFGICEETEEDIDINRLKANPIARYSIEAQRLLEHTV